jgi:uncharacterized membrane protein YgcG
MQLNSAFDGGNGHGKCYRWSRSTFLVAVDTSVVSTILAAMDEAGADGGLTVQLTPLGGAVAAVAPEATAFRHRQANFEVHAIGSWRHGDGTCQAKEAAVRMFSERIRPHGAAGYINIHAGGSPGWLARTYGANLARIEALKLRYDPDDFFHSNAISVALRAGTHPPLHLAATDRSAGGDVSTGDGVLAPPQRSGGSTFGDGSGGGGALCGGVGGGSSRGAGQGARWKLIPAPKPPLQRKPTPVHSSPLPPLPPPVPQLMSFGRALGAVAGESFGKAALL